MMVLWDLHQEQFFFFLTAFNKHVCPFGKNFSITLLNSIFLVQFYPQPCDQIFQRTLYCGLSSTGQCHHRTQKQNSEKDSESKKKKKKKVNICNYLTPFSEMEFLKGQVQRTPGWLWCCTHTNTQKIHFNNFRCLAKIRF